MTTMNAPARTDSNVLTSSPTDGRLTGDRFGEQAKKTVQDVQQLGGMAKGIAQEKLEHFEASASEYLDQGREKVDELGRSLEKAMQANPLKSVLIAAAIGIVFGRFFMGR